MLVDLSAATASPPPEVRFVIAAPSPYTARFDALRAGLGMALQLQRLAEEQRLPVRISIQHFSPEDQPAAAERLLQGQPQVLVVGGSTWSQGSAPPLRRLFELGGGVSLQGVRSTAFATAGGAHTGGEMVVFDSLRSLMGQGALAFTSGQRLMVFSTDERLDQAPGQFTALDCWSMELYAKELLLQAYAGRQGMKAPALASRLGIDLAYYRTFPSQVSALPASANRVCALINPLAAASRPGLAAVAAPLQIPPDALRALFR